MNPRHIIFAFVSAFLVAAATASGTFHESVVGVGANTIAIRMSARTSTTFKVPAGALITVDGLPSSLSDVHAGMEVSISMGLDRDSVQEIIAHTVPPVVAKSSDKIRYRALTKAITNDVVIALTDKRITYGVAGTSTAKAALMMPDTHVYMDNGRIDPSALTVGMQVNVVTADGIHAREIRIMGGDKDK